MRVLITGGTGFLGRHVAWRLKGEGHDVTILGRNDAIGSVLQAHGISYRKADLADAMKVEEACRNQEQVIHSGGLASPWGPYEVFYKANVVGTQNVIAGAQKHGVKRLVSLSTPSLYFDYRHRLLIKETDPLPKPATAYAATKLLADEAATKANASGLPTISLRPRAIFGPGDQAVLVRVLKAAEKGTVPLVGGGKSYVELTYIDNIVDAVLLAMNVPEAAFGKFFNITNGEPVQMKDMLDLLFTSLGSTPKVRHLPFGLAYSAAAVMETYARWFGGGMEPALTKYGVGLMAKSQTLDISAARDILGYRPRVSMREGMAHFARWWQGKGEIAPLAALGLQH